MKQPMSSIQRITIEKIVYPGKALGRGDDGIATFVEGALPGETVEIAVTKSKKTFKEGLLVGVVAGAARRQQPRCPSFGKCGGCSFQHAGYDHQLEIKEQCLQELLARFGVPIEPIVRSPDEWSYRNKMEFSFFSDGGPVSLGLHRKGEFDRYFSVPPCFIADSDFVPVIESILSFVQASGRPCYNKRQHLGFYRHLVLRKAKRTGQILVNLVTNREAGTGPEFFAPLLEQLKEKIASFYWTINGQLSDAVIADEVRLLWGRDALEEQLSIGGRTYAFAISPFSFFQTNTFGTEKLYENVIALFERKPTDRLLDLYCGTGTIGIVLATGLEKVLGVEQVPAAIENARHNAALNGISNIEFAVGSVEKWIKGGTPADCNALVLDPPRGGISGKVVDLIARTRPEKIVYVSCNPATLARDLADISEKAGYRIRRIVPVDMFPQTYHIEVVTSLVKV
jgi:23S rRNA (uracil-5-)-methyltransferase RumA